MAGRKGRSGRKPLPIDEKTVRGLALLGGTNVEIADHFNCSTETLRKRFKDTLKEARADAQLQLRKLQLQSAKAGSVPMQIHLGKVMLGQSDKLDVTSAGKSLSWLDILNKADTQTDEDSE